MKHIIIILSLLFFFSCKEEYIGQYPIDSVEPQCVVNPMVENLPGRVNITYNLPNETDILYVKALYENSYGKIEEVKSSIFNNKIILRGFGRSKKQTIKLITVDRSQNESEPYFLDIEPLDSPIYNVFESLQVYPSWGGIKLKWENPMEEQIMVSVIESREEGDFEFETFYSTEKSGTGTVRGLDTIPYSFNITIKDIYNNHTDTFVKTLTPYFEQRLDGSKFKIFPLAPGYAEAAYSKGIKALFDSTNNGLRLTEIDSIAPYITLDFCKPYVLSRLKMWGDYRYPYSFYNIRVFEVWGTNDPNVVLNPSNWEGWTFIKRFESHKPSGNDDSDIVTAEDKVYFDEGQNFEFPDNLEPMRYFRFRFYETWSKSSIFGILELGIWGK